MKALLRIIILIAIALLVFLVVFPNSFESLGHFFTQAEKKLQDKQSSIAKNQLRQSNFCVGKGNTSINRTERSQSEVKHSESTQLGPKVFINRNPEVFDFVCKGDSLNFMLFAENVDKVLISYENENSEQVLVETIQPVPFENNITLNLPNDWLGSTVISVTGFAKEGKVKLATNKVEFIIQDNKYEKANKLKQERQLSPSYITLFDGKANKRLHNVKIIDSNTIILGRIRLKLSKPILEVERVDLTPDNTLAMLIYLTPSKLEAQRVLKQFKGSIETGKLSEKKLPIKINFSAIDSSKDGELTYRVFGDGEAEIN